MPVENEVRALTRGLHILETLTCHSQGMSLSAIARTVGLAKSSTHRLLQTLVLNGYVKQDIHNNDNYFASLKLLTLSSNLIRYADLTALSRPHLQFLAEITDETVHLVLLDREGAVYVEKVESPNPIRMCSQIGSRAPLHCTGVGKAILAFLPEERREAMLSGNLPRYTDHTVTDPDELREDLKQIRARGYAIDNEEHEKYVRCIAVPLFAHTGQVVGAVSIAAVSYRVDLPTLESWQPMLSERAHQLNAELMHFLDRYI